MSEVYVHEPPTKGKVRLHTTHGDLDVELWSKECPKAARNFVQLCLEGYYDSTIFHRIIQEFIVQGGDPSGSGDGGESVYGESFPDEFHSRLKYRYRGLVGVANRGPGTKTNASQFFITLARADPLNNRHTLFGKVTGHTVYNLMALAAVECDASDRPFDPPVLKSTEVLWNPFDDIVPRDLGKKPLREAEVQDEEEKPAKRETLKELKKGLLSFGDEEEDEEESAIILQNEGPKKKVKVMRSAHDVLIDDTRLIRNAPTEDVDNGQDASETAAAVCARREENNDNVAREEVKQKIRRVEEMRKQTRQKEESSGETSAGNPRDAKSTEELLAWRKQAREEEEANLKKEILKLKQKEDAGQRDADRLEFANLLSEKEKEREMMLLRRKNKPKRQHQATVLDQLSSFTSRLREQRAVAKSEDSSSSTQKEEREDTKLGIKLSEFTAVPDLDEEVDEADGAWMRSGGLKFASDATKAFKIDESRDELAVHDPLLTGDTKFDGEAMEALRKRRNARMKPSLKGDRVDWR